MADGGESDKGVFGRSTMNRIASADELDHYIKVTNPSAWIVTLAALLLVAGVIFWALVAVVPVTVSATGIMLDSSKADKTVVICAVDESTADKINDSRALANVGGVESDNVAVNETPVSASEFISYLDSDFYAESLDLSDWNYVVSIVLDEEPQHTDYMIGTSLGEVHLVPVKLVVSETHPINIVLGKE